MDTTRENAMESTAVLVGEISEVLTNNLEFKLSFEEKLQYDQRHTGRAKDFSRNNGGTI